VENLLAVIYLDIPSRPIGQYGPRVLLVNTDTWRPHYASFEVGISLPNAELARKFIL